MYACLSIGIHVVYMPARPLLPAIGMSLYQSFPDIGNIGDRLSECKVKTFKYIFMCNCQTESLQFMKKLVLWVN